MKIKYINHLGEEINLSKPPLMLEPVNAYNYAWEYEATEAQKNGIKIGGFYRTKKEVSMPMFIRGVDANGRGNLEAFNQALRLFFETVEKDIIAKIPGKLVLSNGEYMTCYIVEVSHSNFAPRYRLDQREIKIVSTYPFWITESTKSFQPVSREEIEGEFLDYTPTPNGYGWSVGNVYNEVDFERKKFIKRVGRVDMGTLTWNYSSADQMFFTTGVNRKVTDTFGYLVCSKYELQRVTWADRRDKTINGSANTNIVTVKDSAYTDAPTFKTAMNGVYLYYELAEPIEIDLPESWNGNLDYNYDYSYETPGIRTWNLDHYATSEFKLTIYGYCENPRILVNGYPYQIFGTVEENEFLVIDSREKTVTHYLNNGTTENWFDFRNKENSVFEPLPSGNLTLTWDGTYGFDILAYLERSEPRWT